MKGGDGKTYTQWNGKPGEETEPGIVEGEGVHGVVVEMSTNGVAGYTTYQLLLALNDVDKQASTAPFNVYTIYGMTDHVMQMPPCFQTDVSLLKKEKKKQPNRSLVISRSCSLRDCLVISCRLARISVGLRRSSGRSNRRQNLTPGSL